MSREEAREIADRVLAVKAADQTRVSNISRASGGNTRFADASITTSGGIVDTSQVDGHGHRRAAPCVGVDEQCSTRRHCGGRSSWPLSWRGCPPTTRS